MKFCLLCLALWGVTGAAVEGDMREWMSNANFTCGAMKITFSADGRSARYVFTNGGGEGKFKIKYRLASATLSFDYLNPQDGPFLLHWATKGSGLLYLDNVKCDYL